MLSWMNPNGRPMTGFDGHFHVGAALEWLIRKLRHVMCAKLRLARLEVKMCAPSIARGRAFELIVATRLQQQ